VHVKVAIVERLVASRARKAVRMPFPLQLPIVRADHLGLDQLRALPAAWQVHLLPIRLAEHDAVALDKFLGTANCLAALLARLDTANGGRSAAGMRMRARVGIRDRGRGVYR
jgi:hypothetical protein